MSKITTTYIKKAGFMLAFLLLGLSIQAQYLLVKTHLAQLPFGQVGLGVEKVFDKQFSVQLNAQYLIPNRGLNYISSNYATEEELKSSLLDGYAFSLETRAYTYEGRTDAVKWYLGVFLRYSEYRLESELEYNEVPSALKGSLITAAGGLQLGINYIIQNKYSIDLTMIGLGFANNEIQVDYRSSEENPPIGQVENGLQDIPIIGSRIQLKRDGDFDLRSQNRYSTLALRFALTAGIIF